MLPEDKESISAILGVVKVLLVNVCAAEICDTAPALTSKIVVPPLFTMLPYRPALVKWNVPEATLLINAVSIGAPLVPKLSTLSPLIPPPFASVIFVAYKLSMGAALSPISNKI